MKTNPTAAVLIIGNEVLSGRTQDANINWLAVELAKLGVLLQEARVVADTEAAIVEAVRALSARYTYVFSTGGIGPTHDDITAACMAKAFGVALELNEEARGILKAHYDAMGTELNEARLRMAHIPVGAMLLENPVSRAPGFKIGNVFVLPGVPKIMRAIFDLLVPSLETGAPVVAHSVTADLREGDIAAPLAEIAAHYPNVDIGSYPALRGTHFAVTLVCKGVDVAAVAAAHREVRQMVEDMGGVVEA